MSVDRLPPGVPDPAVLDGLAGVLQDSVADGNSIGFLDPFTLDDARGWWRAAFADPATVTWVAREGEDVVGVVRLSPAGQPNGWHRAEVTKFLVRSSARGRGHGRALMAALEAEALETGRWLLLLDTETGSPAETIYRSWGWQGVGVVDDYAATPDGALKPTTFLAKRLDGRAVTQG